MDDSIKKLRGLRERAATINETVIDDLKPFFVPDALVFRRLPDSDDKGNVTNTCSCLMALVTTDRALDFLRQTLPVQSDTDAQEKLTEIFEKAVKSEWTSSGLSDNNAFTSLIVLRTAALLSTLLKRSALAMRHPTYEMEKDEAGEEKPVPKEPIRNLKEIATSIGTNPPETFRVDKYPPTPGIAYWFVDAIDHLIPGVGEIVWGKIEKIVTWTAETFTRHVSLVSAQHDAMKDPVAMVLAACLATRLHRIITKRSFSGRDVMIERLPTNVEVEEAVLNALRFQESSGIWPKYFPLFNYKKEGVGSNYLFSFEVLEVIVHEFQQSELMGNAVLLKAVERALNWCESNRFTYALEGKTYQGWNSGGQITTLMQGKPEAWATAMVHMFLHKLRSALSVLIKRRTLSKYGVSPSASLMPDSTAWDKFIDSPVRLRVGNQETTAKTLLQEQILAPIENNESIGDRRSALLFGPPGTAKTSLVRAVAKKVGWPLVELNPSDFLKDGLENIYSTTDSIFKDLNDLWNSVVFFDEMDALAQKRVSYIDVTRQFLTTSMLPKLSRLHGDGRVLFFMATNHQRNFDDAIKRPGRFDLLIHMKPPSWTDKITHLQRFWPAKQTYEDVAFVRTRLLSWVPPNDDLAKILDRFTFGEFKSFLESIGRGSLLRTEVEAMTMTQFREKVDKWGKDYIALHSELHEQPDADLSLLQEYLSDEEASSVQ